MCQLKATQRQMTDDAVSPWCLDVEFDRHTLSWRAQMMSVVRVFVTFHVLVTTLFMKLDTRISKETKICLRRRQAASSGDISSCCHVRAVADLGSELGPTHVGSTERELVRRSGSRDPSKALGQGVRWRTPPPPEAERLLQPEESANLY